MLSHHPQGPGRALRGATGRVEGSSGSYKEGRGQGPLLKQDLARRAGGLKNPRGQTDSAVTHKVESTTNSTGGCSVSYFMDECTVGFGDHATPRPPATLHPNIKDTGEHLSHLFVWPDPPKDLHDSPKHCASCPRLLGETAQSLSFKSVRIGRGAGCVSLGPAPQGDWGPQKGWERVRVTGPSTLIKNGLVLLSSETLLLGMPGNRTDRERLPLLT